MLNIISTDKAPAAIGPYSQGICINELLFSSGQIPIDPLSGLVSSDSMEGQSEQVMKNVAAILEEAGTSFEKVIKTTCFITDMKDFDAFNSTYEKYFISKPARSCVAVKELPKGVLCEVEIIACI